ncbi:outer membrane beta-barrel protein [Helicobacter sp. T3_23-1059]
MQKKYLTIAVASTLASISVANAEKSGAFAGLEAGVNIAPTQLEFGNGTHTVHNFGGTYGLLVGYKQFFAPHIGVRYYANLNYKDGYYARKGQFMIFNYGANVDFLGNFVSKEDLDFGGFVGLGLGGNTSITFATNLDVGLNAGFRATFDSSKTLELGTRISFLPFEFPKNVHRYAYKYTFYSVALRYIHNF